MITFEKNKNSNDYFLRYNMPINWIKIEINQV